MSEPGVSVAPPRVQALGDRALVVTFGDTLSAAVNGQVMRAAELLRASSDASLAEAREGGSEAGHIIDIVPAIASLTLHFDRAVAFDETAKHVSARLASLRQPSGADERAAEVRDIRVRYGGEDGPDLADVAAFAGISPEEVVARHTARVYRVYMLGFLPGFAYLGEVDPSIAAPRRATPRQSVPAGSVGIAGPQTGVYPQDSPGGWQLIGRTPARMFDMAAGRSMLQPGDRVRFVAEAL